MADNVTDWIKKNIEPTGTKTIVSGSKQPHFKARPGPASGRFSQKGGGVLRCVPLGGLDEVGKNMMVFEYGNDAVIVDMGFQFPEEDMLGVDYVIPDITYLRGKESRIRGILITHGHLDHIGAIPYLVEQLGFPVIFGTKLTLGFVKKRLEEFGLVGRVKLHTIDPHQSLQLGSFQCEFFRVNHSIPDGVGIILRTPAGTVVHTGDFKFDFTPLFQHATDFHKIAALGSQGVAALFSDSTNALNPGHTRSERIIGENLDEIIGTARGRVVIAAFASLVDRIQLIINSAHKNGRRVYVSGRSMINNIEIARQLGYIKVPPGAVQDAKKLGRVPDEQVLILTTGAQGEAVSALSRMSLGEHSAISLKKGDTVVLSSSPIPGNERPITAMINNLCRIGAKVIFHQVMDVHTSGHANKEDLKLMISLVKPRYLVPVHGELYMRIGHGEIGRELGMKEPNIKILENGSILEIERGEARISREKASVNYIIVDGKGVGDVGAQILMDRQIMSENGVLVVLITVDEKTKKIVYDPEIISRGFIYMEQSAAIIKEIVGLARKAYTEITERDRRAERGDVKKYVRGALDRFTHKKLDRHPLILPVIAEIKT